MFSAVSLINCQILFGFSLILFHYGLLAGESPLILTSFLEGNNPNIDEAIRLSRVAPDILEGVKSYSGFFNVDKNCGNNLFFWFFPAEQNWKNKPVLLWLKGVPGSSFMSGVFEEVGPLQIVDGKIIKMKFSWSRLFNLLFIDQPAGVGFSYSEAHCYPDSVQEAMRQTHSALLQFFTMFPQLRQNPFYISGAYFVSHYGPSLAMIITERNKQSIKTLQINVKGVLIMNARTNIECQDFSNIIYQLGIADQRMKDIFVNIQKEIVKKVKEKKFLEALVMENNMFVKLKDDTKLPSYHNFASNEEDPHSFVTMIVDKNLRKQLHVGNVVFNLLKAKVQKALLPDYFSSPKDLIEQIIYRDDIFIGLYHGQMEVINPYSSVICFLNTIRWPEKKDFTTARRSMLHLENKLLGWTKVTGNFFHLLVRKVGRYTGVEQGEIGLTLLETIFEPVNSNSILQPE